MFINKNSNISFQGTNFSTYTVFLIFNIKKFYLNIFLVQFFFFFFFIQFRDLINFSTFNILRLIFFRVVFFFFFLNKYSMHIYAYNLIGINSRHTSDTISFSIFFHPRKSRYQQSNRFTKSVTRPAGKLITSLIKIEKLWRAIETDRYIRSNDPCRRAKTSIYTRIYTLAYA